MQLVHQASQYPPHGHHRAGQRHGSRHHARVPDLVGPDIGSFKGLVWLILGVDTWDIVEAGDWQKIQEEHDEQFRFTAALYHEMDACVGAPFLEDMLDSWRYEIFFRLQDGAHIYVIGHEGMLTGIDCALEGVADMNGINYKEFMSELKVNGRWHNELDLGEAKRRRIHADDGGE